MRRIAGLVVLGVLVVGVVTYLIWGRLRPGLPGAVMADLRRAQKFELLTVDANWELHEASATESREKFREFEVIGRRAVTDAAMRERILQALNSSVKEGGTPDECFNPRYAIHAEVDGKAVDLAICFECEQYELFVGDVRTWGPVGNSGEPAIREAAGKLGLEERP